MNRRNYQFRKKPVTIEAFQITEQTRQDNSDWPDWLHEAWNKEPEEPGSFGPVRPETEWAITTLEGMMTVKNGDWVIRGVKGELYPCKDDIFRQTYSPVGVNTPEEFAEERNRIDQALNTKSDEQ